MNPSSTKQMLVPLQWRGLPSACDHADLKWTRDLPDSVYLALWQRWPEQDLPTGYDGYVVSFHLEAVDCDWVARQSQRLSAPIVLLHDGDTYDWPFDMNVTCLRYIYWHRQLEKMLAWFGPVDRLLTTKTYLASAYCNRITQSKLVIFTAMAEYLGQDACLLTLSDWLRDKDVHFREPSGLDTIDGLSDIFWDKYFGQVIAHDDFDPSKNYQSFTSNFHTPAYRDCAMHFTNESDHYSLMGDHIRPGPFLTEKTLKCLAAGQTFVPVGQFDTYGTLEKLGFKFSYPFDRSWDQDPGNLTRLAAIVRLIKDLQHVTKQDIVEQSIESCRHNMDHIYSGDFAKICEKINLQTIQRVYAMLK